MSAAGTTLHEGTSTSRRDGRPGPRATVAAAGSRTAGELGAVGAAPGPPTPATPRLIAAAADAPAARPASTAARTGDRCRAGAAGSTTGRCGRSPTGTADSARP